jgi:hypothetical protein
MAIDDSIRFLETIYGEFTPNSGLPLRAIKVAEKRIGARLPTALTTLYRRTGAAAALHQSHNTLVDLDHLGFADDHLIFYEENQGVVAWGVARANCLLDDPPVVQGQVGEDGVGWTFHPEFRSLSEFACAQGAWNAVQGGLPFVGVWQQSGGGRRVDSTALTDAFGAAALATDGMRVWLVDGGVAVDAGDGYLGLATRDADQFKAASARVGIALESWDYATVRDG